MDKVRAKAHANIALIKYWGKKDEKFIIPFANSISFTLDDFYTVTEISEGAEDRFILDGVVQDQRETEKVFEFVDLFRKRSEVKLVIDSKNHVPTAAGLASSASAYACLTVALNEFFKLGLDKKELSRLARRGSGSACRSIFGGFAEWVAGDSDETSYARKLDYDMDMAMIAVILNKDKKKVASRAGMKQTVETCPFYESWVRSTDEDIEKMHKALKDKDFDQVGRLAEGSALKMHAIMMATQPSIIYLQEETLATIRLIKEMRDQGLSVYFTMDAGPNVKIICKPSQKDQLMEELLKHFDEENLVYSERGGDAVIL